MLKTLLTQEIVSVVQKGNLPRVFIPGHKVRVLESSPVDLGFPAAFILGPVLLPHHRGTEKPEILLLCLLRLSIRARVNFPFSLTCSQNQ